MDMEFEESGDWDEEAESVCVERGQGWEEERRERREENARLRAALEKSRADNEFLARSIRDLESAVMAQRKKNEREDKS